jgi:DNA-binding NtrC family response regulator
MPSRTVRVRDRNQVTLPPEVMEAISVRVGDFLEIMVTGEGTLTLAPKRLVTWNSPQAEEADQEAERDIAQKRYGTFESAKALKESLLARKGPAETPLPRPTLAQVEREMLIRALKLSRWRTPGAAKALGIDQKELALRLKEHGLSDKIR